MGRTLEELLEDQAAITLAIKAAQAAKVVPAIDTTRIVGGIDAAIAGLSAAVVALQAVKAMLANNDQKAETAVAAHLPEGVDMSDGLPVVVPIASAPASIEAAATAAEAPKKSKWGWLKKATPWLITGGLAVATGGASAAVPVVLDAIQNSVGDAGTATALIAAGGAALEAGKKIRDIISKPKE